MTLLEADITLLGLVSSPIKQTTSDEEMIEREVLKKPNKSPVEQAQTSTIEILQKLPPKK